MASADTPQEAPLSKDAVLEAGGIGQIGSVRPSFRDWIVAMLAGSVLFLIAVVTIWALLIANSYTPTAPPAGGDPQAWGAAQRAIMDGNAERALKLFGEIVVKGLMPAFLSLSAFFAGSHNRA